MGHIRCEMGKTTDEVEVPLDSSHCAWKRNANRIMFIYFLYRFVSKNVLIEANSLETIVLSLTMLPATEVVWNHIHFQAILLTSSLYFDRQSTFSLFSPTYKIPCLPLVSPFSLSLTSLQNQIGYSRIYHPLSSTHVHLPMLAVCFS